MVLQHWNLQGPARNHRDAYHTVFEDYCDDSAGDKRSALIPNATTHISSSQQSEALWLPSAVRFKVSSESLVDSVHAILATPSDNRE